MPAATAAPDASPASPGTRGPDALPPAPVRRDWLLPLLWFNLLAEIGIVVTGGLVRLTGSGLGCPTWPQCDPGSFTPVIEAADGIHPYIEFGNRTLTGVVGLAIVAILVALHGLPGLPGLRAPSGRAALRPWAWLVLAGVAAQAVVGGITVLTGLHPATVAFHFLQSMVLVALSAVLLWRHGEDDGPARPVAPRPVLLAARAATVVACVLLALGTVVTGSGPHSGDADTPARFDLDPRTVSWLHADSATLFVGLVVAVLLAVHVAGADRRAQRMWAWVLGVTLAQGLVGYVQYATDLPEALVLVHMLGASLLTWAIAWGLLSLRRRDEPA